MADTGDDPAVRALVARIAENDDPAQDVALRRELAERCMPMATSVARRFRNRGEAFDELVQVACLGLVKATQGFDARRGKDFVGYAMPTITGEVKRHFRDHGWQIRPPRRVQELRSDVVRTGEELTQELGRSPRMSEIAARLEVDVDEVAECLASGESYHLRSIDAPVTAGDGEVSIADSVGAAEPQYDLVEDIVSLRDALETVAPRERRILALRYFHDFTQQQIAQEVGVTQMQVSRLLTRTHEQLRRELEQSGPE
ncbi:SigB/SigF/SigG family RNA polymerase sigma factor [Kineosporia sp. R_H_3]|uniref:SigB/SigF/SigG family RNA polymerase sigma factor n=1 Tax=Kineosporia sp. R_H_3 TaxID=1961848 RepID=UPI001304732E|nr:SigB/SigF/SigG family RNA polymerase sigma factor [Kineosporia sp. R_H_3]